MRPFISNLLGARSKASSCGGKRRHSRLSAEYAVQAMAQKHHEPFEAYRCRYCDFWHVGHPLFWRWSDVKKPKKGVLL
jgi:hypothetical protein